MRRFDPGALACVPFLSPAFEISERDDEGRRRAALADWLASPKNVLTWRSIANRLWHYHFGRGIVETPNDFGRNGALPTHPELLDWLAVAIRDNGQSMKALHRLIVCSAVYRQAASDNPGLRRDRRATTGSSGGKTVAGWMRKPCATACWPSPAPWTAAWADPVMNLSLFKDDHSPIYDHSDPTRIDGPQGAPSNDLPIRRAQRPQPVHGGARLRRPQPQHAGPQPNPHRASGTGALE